MSVTRADIQRIAELAELSVDDATAAQLEQQLSRILDYVAQLRELPSEPDGTGGAAGVRLRKDDVRPDALQIPPADFAPVMKQGLFLVPKIAELAPGAADE
jgi:aspartyl/glutamyl-tRNA(Asn/Gln) amidotransferase C subunit